GGVGFGTDWLRVAANQLGGRVDRNRGVSGQTASQIVGRFFADTAPPHDVAIFWLGRNDMGDPGRVGEAAHPDTVKKYLAQAIAALSGDKRFLVLSVLNGDFPDEQSGQSRYAAIVLLNTDLAAKYPANFIDVRTMLVAAANAAMATDMANQAADVPPASLRFDELHLNDAGHALVGKAVAAFLATRDW
ncbi:MAG: hypothetical protein JWM95_5214, partial [Gemmatimonadetes bacterium]|nr:hypothetical protein [Gemmatimonadota bacterium]